LKQDLVFIIHNGDVFIYTRRMMLLARKIMALSNKLKLKSMKVSYIAYVTNKTKLFLVYTSTFELLILTCLLNAKFQKP